MKSWLLIMHLSVITGVLVCCGNAVRTDDKESVEDSVKRPNNVSRQASLVNLGGDEMPVYQWVEYAGKLINEGQVYNHIYGFRYFDVHGELLSTVYYENMDIRSGKKTFDASTCKIRLFPGDATIEVSNNTDTLLFFHVLESDEFKRTYNGIDYDRVPAIYYEQTDDIGFTSDEDIEFNIRKEKDVYIVTFTGVPVNFKLVSSCEEPLGPVSFLNLEEGRMYFINKKCYLELTHADDLEKIKSLRR